MSKILDRLSAYISKANNQELIIKYLRTLKFEFFTYEIFTDKFKRVSIDQEHSDYSFMVRKVNVVLDGKKSTSWDTRLVIGIKLLGEKTDKVLIYRDDSLFSIFVKPWEKEVKINFKKVKMNMKFDRSMTYKERRQWRDEHVRVLRDPNHQQSTFYQDHVKHVQFL